jgi:tRNA (guanosine-2'-O-)-methyltransferase
LSLLPGFVESFNISVAAALIMYEAQQQRVRKLKHAGDLTAQQQEQLLAAFLLRGVVSD